MIIGKYLPATQVTLVDLFVYISQYPAAFKQGQIPLIYFTGTLCYQHFTNENHFTRGPLARKLEP